MQKNQPSSLSMIWIFNLILFITYIVGGPSLSFLKSSVLEYDNITSDPFDGAIYPIAYVPDWSKPENMNKTRLFDSFNVSDFINIPEYDTELLADVSKKTTDSIILHYEYPVVYMGSYRLNYIEYDGSHCGVDIRAPIGTPIVSIANGVVVQVKDIESGDGKFVIIRHDNVDIDGTIQTIYSEYAHLSEVIAIEGTKIKRGEVLGKVGMTGITTTPHLHFQIDKSTAPFHMYWPYTFKEASDAGLDFFSAINVGLGKENAIRYTIHPMDFIKNHPALNSAPVELSTTGNTVSETKQIPLVVSSQMVADTANPSNAAVETVVPKIEPPIVPITAKQQPAPVVMEQPKPFIPENTATPVATVPAFIPDNTHFFSDIPTGSPFYAATKYLAEANVTHGYADGGFHPSDTITRSETVLLYDRLFKNGGTDTEIDLPFLDILPSDELAQALTRAFTQGIVSKSSYFRPNDPLTRAEAITLLIRTSGIPLETARYTAFQDVKLSNTHRIYINTFAKYLGIRGTSFEPDKNITRGELAKILYMFDQKRKK